MITIFYDGQCGLCTKEINHYRKIAPEGIFHWQDITESMDELEKAGIRLSDALRLLHAQDSNGNMHIGVDAFILIWKHIERWKIVAAFVSLPIIHSITNSLYRLFANWRFKRLSHCQIATRNEEHH